MTINRTGRTVDYTPRPKKGLCPSCGKCGLCKPRYTTVFPYNARFRECRYCGHHHWLSLPPTTPAVESGEVNRDCLWARNGNATCRPSHDMSVLRSALTEIANGVERRLPDGSTVMDDHPDASEIACSALAAINGETT